MLNQVILIGRLGKDPEVKSVGDTKVCKFSVATSESYKDKQGNKQEKTEWHNIVIWGNLADICGKYLKKGSLVSLQGKITTNTYEKDGVKKYATEILCNTMIMLDGKNDSNSTAQTQSPQEEAPVTNEENADDLPF